MIEKQSTEGSMTIKIDVTMVKEFIPNYDPNVKGESREISKPQFKHKVTSAVKISDEKSELSPWDSRLQVTSRGYMLGYNDLKDPSVSGFFRFLAKVGDNRMKMQIVKIRFGGRK